MNIPKRHSSLKSFPGQTYVTQRCLTRAGVELATSSSCTERSMLVTRLRAISSVVFADAADMMSLSVVSMYANTLAFASVRAEFLVNWLDELDDCEDKKSMSSMSLSSSSILALEMFIVLVRFESVRKSIGRLAAVREPDRDRDVNH